MKKGIKSKKLAMSAMALVTTLMGTVSIAGSVHASPPIAGSASAQVPLEVFIENIPALTITVGGSASSTGVASIRITPNYAGGVFGDSDDVSISVATSNRTGYYLNMTTTSVSLNSSDNNGSYIPGLDPTVTTGYTTESFPANRWGYALKTGETTYSNYYGVGDGVTLQDGDTPTGGVTSTIKFGTKADATIPSGSYSTTVVFTAVSKPSLYMQDVALWKDTVRVGESLQVIDNRDMKQYWVTRVETDPDIPDSRADCTGSGTNRVCTQLWMTQNLDLDLEAGTITYTHYNTDLGYSNNDTNVIWTPQAATTTINDDNETRLYVDRSFNPGDIYYVTSNSNNYDYRWSLDQCIENGYTESDCAHYHVGNYYNFYTSTALSATSGGNPIAISDARYTDMPNSICPAGWRLPYGPVSSADYSDFDYLFRKNNVIEDYSGYNNWTTGYATHIYGDTSVETNGFRNIRSQPLWFVRAGYCPATCTDQASRGYYWLNTILDYDDSDYMTFYNDTVVSASYNWRYIERSVRCLAR